MASFSLILAIFKAIPALKAWFDQFLVWYTEREIRNIKKEYLDAIKKTLTEQDQRDLEKAFQSPRAGEFSGQGEIRDSLPGVDPTP